MTSEAEVVVSPPPSSAPTWCSFKLDADGQLTEISPGIEKLTGFSVQHLKQQPMLLTELILPAERPAYQEHIAQAGQNPAGSTVTVRLRQPATQRQVTLQEFRKPIVASGKLQGFEGIWLDVSRASAFENRMATAAWKETLGLLIPGLIHEFNNTLTSILSLSDLFLSQIDATHAFHDGLGLIKQNIQQASQRLQRWHSLARSQPGQRCYQDLNEAARETVDLLRRSVRRSDLELTTNNNTLAIYADPVQLQQTLIQLVLNAIEAMPEGGHVRIQTHYWEQLPAAMPSIRLPAVSLSVTDVGAGMSQPELRNIFDPLYTTKPGRDGVGLGLHYARMFAHAHQGTLTAQSQPGFGSIITLWLPQADFSEAENGPAN